MDTKPIIRAHSIWMGMKSRCSNKRHISYFRYGGAGITVCERWEDFDNFFSDMGTPPAGHSIDRIDGTKGYSPENCRWATREEQQNNIKSNVNITHEGKTFSIGKWARITGVNTHTLYYRIVERGLPPEIAFLKENFRNISGLKLGGMANGAKNRAKTHCKWGHEFTPENTLPKGQNGRGCRACKNSRMRRPEIFSDEITTTRKNAVLVTLGEETLNAAQWSKKLSIPRNTIVRRIKDGKSPEQILSIENLPHAFLGEEPPIAAIRRAKTHCKNAHELSGENLYVKGDGNRACKTCVMARKRKFNEKAKAARHARGLKRINPRWET